MEERYRPARALAHPAWWVALVVLVLNDHLLKGAGVLPGAITGKVSDFAGLLVAPVALAALLRLGSRRAVALAHVAVGLGFALVNVWAGAARGLEAATALTPLPWAVTVDPSDLLALPMIGVSWRWLVPRMTRPAVAMRPWAARGGVALGTLACLATSPPPETQTVYPDWNTDLVLANDTTETLVLRVRPLKPSVFVDCETVRRSPSTWLSRPLFDSAETWILEPERNIPIRGTDSRQAQAACHVYLVEGSGFASALLFWMDGDYPTGPISSGPDEVHGLRAIRIQGAGLMATLESHPAVFSTPVEETGRVDSVCALPGPEPQVDWSLPLPLGTRTLLGVRSAPDGCHALTLSSGGASGERWYLFLGGVPLPFVDGDELTFTAITRGQELASVEGVEIFGPTKRLVAARGLDVAPFGSARTHHQEIAGCPPLQDDCGSVPVPLSVVVSDGDGATAAELVSGDSHELSDGGGELHLLRAVRLPVADAACLPYAEDYDTYLESVYVRTTTRGAGEGGAE